MMGSLAACFLAFAPSPPAHATDMHVEAWEAWQAEQAQAQWQECTDAIHDLNGPYRKRTPALVAQTQVPAPKLGNGVEQWRPAVAAHDWPVDQALAVLACESGGDPSAYNPSGATGLYQIKGFWVDPSRAGSYPGYDLWNPTDNITVAYFIWRYDGNRSWKHWTCKP